MLKDEVKTEEEEVKDKQVADDMMADLEALLNPHNVGSGFVYTLYLSYYSMLFLKITIWASALTFFEML